MKQLLVQSCKAMIYARDEIIKAQSRGMRGGWWDKVVLALSKSIADIQSSELMGIARTVPIAESQVQPNAGWGDICTHCRYVFRDSAKYEPAFAPSYACVRVIHGGPSAFMPNLVRYVDGTESCGYFLLEDVWE